MLKQESPGFVRLLQNVDQFRAVSRDLTRGTMTGGVFTAIAYCALVLLLIAELGAFMRSTYETIIIMDQNDDKQMMINFDMLLYDLPCKYVKIGVWDKFGWEKMDSSDVFSYVPVDHTGTNRGTVYSQEEIKALEDADNQTDVTDDEQKDLDADWSTTSDHFQHHDFHKAVTFHDFTLVNFFAEWCSHCRKFSPQWMDAKSKISEKMNFQDADGKETTVKMLKVNCVDFGQHCQEAKISAFPSIRLYKRDGSFEAYRLKRSYDNIVQFLTNTIKNSHQIIARHHAIFNEGCQVYGAMQVPRVPGHLYFQAETTASVNINPAFTNVSHRINHLSFGDPQIKKKTYIPTDMVKHLAPLDGKSFTVSRFHEAPQHYLKVVSTVMSGRKDVFYQITHTDRVRKLKLEDKLNVAPQVRFTWDFSPMSVVVKPKSKRWYEFLTSLFAILGGTYTIVELFGGAVDTIHTTVKEAMGKSN